MMNFLNLALTPTALIGLNKDLKVPKSFKCTSNAKPSTYKYPEFIKLDKDKKKEKVATAVLSTTTKAKARKDRKEGKTGEEVVSSPSPKKNEGGEADKEMTNEEKKDGEEEKKEEVKLPEPEQDFQELKNPSRVLK
jgi:26S proteasome regulatory subunit N2